MVLILIELGKTRKNKFGREDEDFGLGHVSV